MMRKFWFSTAFCILLVAGPRTFAQPNCGIYLSVSATNIASGTGYVATWSIPGGVVDAVLQRSFIDNGQIVSSERYTDLLDGPTMGIQFIANPDGYDENLILTLIYHDGTEGGANCLVTVNAPQETTPQVISFGPVFAGRDDYFAIGKPQTIQWETRNVPGVTLMVFPPGIIQKSVPLLEIPGQPPSGQYTLTVPASYTHTTIRLLLLLDGVEFDRLPPAAFLELAVQPAAFAASRSPTRISSPTPSMTRPVVSQVPPGNATSSPQVSARTTSESGNRAVRAEVVGGTVLLIAIILMGIGVSLIVRRR